LTRLSQFNEYATTFPKSTNQQINKSTIQQFNKGTQC